MSVQLSSEERDILAGKQGETLRKVLQSVVVYGEAFDARRLVPLTGAPHMVTSFGANVIAPHFEMMDEIIRAGLKSFRPFTVNPRPIDHHNVPSSLLEKLVFGFVYGKQAAYEKQLAAAGLKSEKAFSCACYLPQVGNTPEFGSILAWSESSAVVFANSVLGARTNRNSGGIDLLCNIIAKAPEFGLLTDAGRQADWLVELKTKWRPDAQLLGSAVGLRVREDVPYITGLDHWLGSEMDDPARDYLKDMGAASASNGAVGLYHVEGLTPEARQSGRDLLKPNHKTLTIDDTDLKLVLANYPQLWKDRNAEPKLCFIGCPHLSLPQLHLWTDALAQALERVASRRIQVPTVLCAAPETVEAFRRDETAREVLLATGARLASICPLMYMNNPLCGRKPVITNSNKLRTYSTARFLPDEEVLDAITVDLRLEVVP